MTDRPGFWELAVSGVAVGGTGAWGLAAAARVGVLRLLLDVFPRATWDVVTWGLIPALLLAPPAAQGAVLAWFDGRRPARVWRAIGASVLGTLVAMAVFGAAILDGVRRLPHHTAALVAKSGPDALIVAFGILLGAGWLCVVGRLARQRWLGRIALPLAAAGTFVLWRRAYGHIVALSYVLDRPEAQGFFAAVAIGGAVGAAWAVRRGSVRAAGTGTVRAGAGPDRAQGTAGGLECKTRGSAIGESASASRRRDG